ncbi:hypothetical protein J6590_057736 [Homalodisca vitripennis]|nr:hypothetical protein J6590_057736 [Homalodisca vitripennis]
MSGHLKKMTQSTTSSLRHINDEIGSNVMHNGLAEHALTARYQNRSHHVIGSACSTHCLVLLWCSVNCLQLP